MSLKVRPEILLKMEWLLTEDGNLGELADVLSDNMWLLEEKTQEGMSILAIATKNHKIQIVNHLINVGADVNSTNHANQTVLFLACWGNDINIVQLLLDNGANPDLQDQRGWTALMIAAFKGYATIVNLLLTYGADPDLIDKFGKKALNRTSSPQISYLLQSSQISRVFGEQDSNKEGKGSKFQGTRGYCAEENARKGRMRMNKGKKVECEKQKKEKRREIEEYEKYEKEPRLNIPKYLGSKSCVSSIHSSPKASITGGTGRTTPARLTPTRHHTPYKSGSVSGSLTTRTGSRANNRGSMHPGSVLYSSIGKYVRKLEKEMSNEMINFIMKEFLLNMATLGGTLQEILEAEISEHSDKALTQMLKFVNLKMASVLKTKGVADYNRFMITKQEIKKVEGAVLGGGADMESKATLRQIIEGSLGEGRSRTPGKRKSRSNSRGSTSRSRSPWSRNYGVYNNHSRTPSQCTEYPKSPVENIEGMGNYTNTNTNTNYTPSKPSSPAPGPLIEGNEMKIYEQIGDYFKGVSGEMRQVCEREITGKCQRMHHNLEEAVLLYLSRTFASFTSKMEKQVSSLITEKMTRVKKSLSMTETMGSKGGTGGLGEGKLLGGTLGSTMMPILSTVASSNETPILHPGDNIVGPTLRSDVGLINLTQSHGQTIITKDPRQRIVVLDAVPSPPKTSNTHRRNNSERIGSKRLHEEHKSVSSINTVHGDSKSYQQLNLTPNLQSKQDDSVVFSYSSVGKDSISSRTHYVETPPRGKGMWNALKEREQLNGYVKTEYTPVKHRGEISGRNTPNALFSTGRWKSSSSPMEDFYSKVHAKLALNRHKIDPHPVRTWAAATTHPNPQKSEIKEESEGEMTYYTVLPNAPTIETLHQTPTNVYSSAREVFTVPK